MHPSKDELSDFLLGKLPGESSDSVATHLDACAPCQETIRAIEPGADKILEGLRAARAKTPLDPACAAAMEKAAQLVSPPAPSGPSKVEFLANLQKSGVLNEHEFLALTQSADVITAADAATLARKLFETKRLTKFQAEQLYQGKSRGFLFGDYVVLDRLGAGGMGQVFKARHRRMDRVVALKLIAGAALKNADAVKRFQREVKAAARLVHPNIVIAHDAGEQQGVHYLVMEFVDGQDLSARLKKKGPLPIRDVVDVVMQAARGLAFAHGEGVVHRDIKPANLLLDAKGVVKILDMGLARLDEPLGAAADDGLTQSGQVMGTVDYMAPEQALNTRDATAAADVYSLGCTLFRLLTGQALFDGQTVVEKIIAHREKAAPSLAKIRNDCPPALEALFEQMVAKKPEDRPKMAQIVERLIDIAAGMSGKVSSPSTIGGPGANATELFVGSKPSVSSPESRSQGEPGKVKHLTAATAVPVAKASTVPTAAAVVSTPRAKLPAASIATSSAAGGGRKKPPQKVLLAAAGAGAVAIACVVWLVVRDKDGKPIAQIEMPSGGSTTIQEQPVEFADLAAPKPSATVARPTPQSVNFSTPASPAGGSTQLPSAGPQIAADGSAITATAVVSQTSIRSDDHALHFDGQGAHVDVPAFGLQGFDDLTIEATVTCEGSPRMGLMVEMYCPSGETAWLATDPYTGHEVKTGIIRDGKLIGPSRVILIQPGQKTRLALVVRNGEVDLFGDGKRLDQKPSTHDITTTTRPVSLRIGGSAPGSPQRRFFLGLIDEVRISRVARYDADYSPTDRLETDAETVALYHFDEGTGDVLRDSSGNNHHGKIVGAKWVRADGRAIEPVLNAAPGEAPPLGAAASVVTATTNASGTVIDVLPLIDVQRDGIQIPGKSNWRRTPDGLAVDLIDKEQAPLTLPVPLKGDYRIIVDVTNKEDFGGQIWTYLPVATDQAISGVLSKTYTACVVEGHSHFALTNPSRQEGDMFRFGSRNVYSWTIRNRENGCLLEIARDGTIIYSYTVSSRDLPPISTSTVGSKLKSRLATLQCGIGGSWEIHRLAIEFLSEASAAAPGIVAETAGPNSTNPTKTPPTPTSSVDVTPSSMPAPAVAPFDAAQAHTHQEAWAKHLGTTVETTNSQQTRMILIPPGEFLMGTTQAEFDAFAAGKDPKDPHVIHMRNEVPQRKVRLTTPFRLAATEVTVGQFREFTEATGYRTAFERGTATEAWNRTPYQQTDACPVAYLSWSDAAEFCKWLTDKEAAASPGTRYRLPTEAEWEFACRAGTTTAKYWGELNGMEFAYRSNQTNEPSPVGKLRPNAFGLLDMQGNVREWVHDFFAPPPTDGQPLVDPTGPPTGQDHVERGGGRINYSWDTRSSFRNRAVVSAVVSYSGNRGFRLAQSLSSATAAGQPSVAAATTPVATPLPASTPSPPTATPAATATPATPAKTVIADPNDPIAKRLATAKTVFERETEAIARAVEDSFEKRETAARRASDKVVVDQIRLEREAYAKNGWLPPTLWATLDARIESANRTLLAAYETAIRDYVRGKKDAEADALLKEADALRTKAGFIPPFTAAAPAKKLSPKELFDFNREIAAWAVTKNARVVLIAQNGQTAELQGGQIPTVPFAIKELYLSVPEVVDADMEKLALLPSLTHLDLRGTGVTDDGVVKFAGMTGLKYLNVHARGVTDRSLAAIATMKGLETLDIAWAKISDAGLDAVAGLPNLKTLNLFAATVTDQGMRKLARLKYLRSLELKNPKIAPTTVQYLEASIPGLRVSR